MMKDRLIVLINLEKSERLKFSKFEKLTGIKKDTVKNLYHGKQRINEEHIEAICKTYPEYKYWFVFGDEMPEKGQISPMTNEVKGTG